MGVLSGRWCRTAGAVVVAALTASSCSSSAGTTAGSTGTQSRSNASAGSVAATGRPAAGEPNPFRIGRPLIIPHGGGDGLFPEDTLYAYLHSIALGGDVVDIDVEMTADGVPIAFHDSTLQRTTNGSGNVESKTYAELGLLDAGWGFTKGGTHPFRNMGLRIPTVASLLDAFPHMLVTLDVKPLSTHVVEALCTIIDSRRRAGDVFVGVDGSDQVALFRKLCPDVQTSGTDAERRAMRIARDTNDSSFVTHQLVSQPQYLGPDGQPRVTAASLAFSHRHDIAVLTYVVDDPTVMRTLINLGVDGIYTRRPDVLHALEVQMGLDTGGDAASASGVTGSTSPHHR